MQDARVCYDDQRGRRWANRDSSTPYCRKRPCVHFTMTETKTFRSAQYRNQTIYKEGPSFLAPHSSLPNSPPPGHHSHTDLHSSRLAIATARLRSRRILNPWLLYSVAVYDIACNTATTLRLHLANAALQSIAATARSPFSRMQSSGISVGTDGKCKIVSHSAVYNMGLRACADAKLT